MLDKKIHKPWKNRRPTKENSSVRDNIWKICSINSGPHRLVKSNCFPEEAVNGDGQKMLNERKE